MRRAAVLLIGIRFLLRRLVTGRVFDYGTPRQINRAGAKISPHVREVVTIPPRTWLGGPLAVDPSVRHPDPAGGSDRFTGTPPVATTVRERSVGCGGVCTTTVAVAGW